MTCSTLDKLIFSDGGIPAESFKKMAGYRGLVFHIHLPAQKYVEGSIADSAILFWS